MEGSVDSDDDASFAIPLMLCSGRREEKGFIVFPFTVYKGLIVMTKVFCVILSVGPAESLLSLTKTEKLYDPAEPVPAAFEN